jgi:hypothetical protein
MSDIEKASRDESASGLAHHGNVAYTIDQRRRAALAEIDNAKFSYVFPSLV